MKQKYLILKNDEKTKLIIREFAELDKEMFSLLCEETFDDESVKSAIAKGQKALISTLRTKNMFPIGIYAKEIASTVTKMYESEDDQSVELFLNDYDLLSKEQEKQATVDEIDSLLDDEDVTKPGFNDEKDDIKKITHPLNISDDDPVNIDDD